MSEELEPIDDVEVVARRRTVATALPLKRNARERLAALLDARVVDVREPIDDVDVVLTPACSPQLLRALKRRYDSARVVIVELDDWEFDIELVGPVKRLLRSGADAYVLADSLDELAAKLGDGTAAPDEQPLPAELTTGATVDDLIAAFLRESVEYSVRTHAPHDR